MKSNLLIFDEPALYTEGLSQILSQITFLNQVDVCINQANLQNKLDQNKHDFLMFGSHIMMLSEIYQAIEEIKTENPKLKIILIGNDYDVTSIRKLFSKGINAYLDKNSTLNELMECFSSMENNEAYLCSYAKEKMINFISSSQTFEATQVKESLTKRETEILKLICEGLSSKNISEQLFISINTVETHRKKILTKLNVKNSVGIVKYALENNIID